MTETLSHCGACGATLAEPPDIPADKRVPCPECGSTRRTIYGSATLTVNVTVGAATARASASSPKVVIENLEDAGFSVQWLRLSEGGAWMVRVFDRQDEWLDGAIADDPQDAILAVSERLLPRSKPAE
jgi:ribosomal protein S27E